ncbi:MAG: CRTAC1 family protein [Acidobacteriota bacterium]
MNRGTGRVRGMLTSILVAALLGCSGEDQAIPMPRADGGETEGTTTDAGGDLHFEDVADQAGLDFVHWNGMSGRLYLAEITCGGGALFDADGDGDLDIYLLQGRHLGDGEGAPPSTAGLGPNVASGQPVDRLFRNDLDGPQTLRFTDVTADMGAFGDGYGCAVATGDADGDGRVDLYLANLGPNRLLRNLGPDAEGRLRFADVTAEAGVGDPGPSTAAAFFDADLDGRLDLFVGNYGDFQPAREPGCFALSGAPDYCGPGAYPARADRLYRNLGPGPDGVPRFQDVTEAAGLGMTAPRPTLGAVTGDFDGDGDTDLYVANDGEPNHLWSSEAAGAEPGTLRFAEMALLAGAAMNGRGAAEASMGVDAGDVDGDGDLDLAIAHLVRETHTLYANDGRGQFRDITDGSGIGPPSLPATGFGTVLADFDLDGRLDLAVANGAVTRIPEQVAAGDPLPLRQRDQLFRNLGPDPRTGGDARFEDVTGDAGPGWAVPAVSRGLAAGDVDNDGDVDLLVTDVGGPPRLLRNTRSQERPWLGVRAAVTTPEGAERDVQGVSVALLRSGRPVQWRRAGSDGSYASAGDPRVRFGLGDGAEGLGVRVVWPGGVAEDFPVLGIRRYLHLRRGEGSPAPERP